MSLRFFYKPSSGLTLIEMLVVISIFTILTIIVLSGLPAFRNRLALDLLAEEVAVTIRQAQVYGAATKVFGQQFPSHGVVLPNDPKKQSASFIVFADSNKNNIYDKGNGCGKPPTECREEFTLRGGVNIKSVRGCDPTICYDLNFDPITVIFKRPGSDAYFYSAGESIKGQTGIPSYLEVDLYSEKSDDSRGIAIWRTGHIHTCRYLDSC